MNNMPRVLPFEPYGQTLARRGKSVNALGENLSRLVEHAKVKGFTIFGADEAACAIDMHPTEIWPEFYGVRDLG